MVYYVVVLCHKYLHRYCIRYCTRSTCTHVCSHKLLARDRTAFYTCSERQNEPYAKMTALSPAYRSTAQPLHQSNPKASGPR